MDKNIIENNMRMEWLDQAKAVCMYFVVLGHSLLKVDKHGLFKIIYSFHMPIFFLLSGFVFNPDKYKSIMDCIKDKIVKLIYPYILLNLLCIPLWYINVKTGMVVKDSLLTVLAGIFYSNAKVIRAPLNATWFIVTLFLAEIIYFIIHRYFKEDRFIFIMSFGLFLLGIISPMGKDIIKAPMHLGVAFVAQFYYACGYLLRKNFAYVMRFFEKRKIIKILCLLGIGLFFAKINKQVDFSNENYRDVVDMLASSFSFSLAIICIIKNVHLHSNWMSFIGKNTLIILALHIPILRIYQAVFPVFLSSVPYAILASIVVFITTIPCIWFIRRYLNFCIVMPKKMQEKIYNIVI